MHTFEMGRPAVLIICIEQTDSIVLDPIGPQFPLSVWDFNFCMGSKYTNCDTNEYAK